MGDLNRDDAQIQPLTVPILGTPDGTYTAPSEAWDGAPVREPLSSGAESAGVAPNAYFGAQTFNDIAGRLGQGLATILDSAALTWERPAANTGQPNDNSVGTRAAFVVGPYWYYGGVYSEALIQFNTAKLFYSLDGHTWVDADVHGLDGGDTPTGFAVGHSRISAVDYVTVLGWENVASGEMRKSDNLGGTWADAGTLPASFSPGASVGGFFNPDPSGVGRFFVCGPSQLYYSDHDDLAGEWTRITTSSLGWTGAPPPGPLCFASSPTECAIGINGAPSIIHSSDGDTWAAAPLPTNPGDGVLAMHWSASHDCWIILSAANGRVLAATEGFGTITELAQITDHAGNAVTGLVDVCSLGRTVIVSAGTRLWVSRDLQTWRALPVLYTDDGVNLDQWTWIRSLNGRLWVGRKRQVSGDASLEYAMSAVLPAEFVRNGGTF